MYIVMVLPVFVDPAFQPSAAATGREPGAGGVRKVKTVSR